MSADSNVSGDKARRFNEVRLRPIPPSARRTIRKEVQERLRALEPEIGPTNTWLEKIKPDKTIKFDAHWALWVGIPDLDEQDATMVASAVSYGIPPDGLNIHAFGNTLDIFVNNY